MTKITTSGVGQSTSKWNPCRMCGKHTRFRDFDGAICFGTRTLLKLEEMAKQFAAKKLAHCDNLSELDAEAERWLKKRIIEIEEEGERLVDCRQLLTQTPSQSAQLPVGFFTWRPDMNILLTVSKDTNPSA